MRAQVLRQLFGGIQVVGAVEHDERFFRNDFEPARPACRQQALPQALKGNPRGLVQQQFTGGEHQRCVSRLIVALKPRDHIGPDMEQAAVREAARARAPKAEIAAQPVDRGRLALRGLLQRGPRGSLTDTGDDRPTAFDDAGFFTCDLGDRGAQVLAVFQGDVRDDRQLRRDHVGGVHAAAHAGFDHGPIDPSAGRTRRRPWRW